MDHSLTGSSGHGILQTRILEWVAISFSRLNQEETENMKRCIASIEIESMIKNLPTNKSPGPDGFIGRFYQMFGEELTPILLKLFQKIAEGGTLPSLFLETIITLIPRLDKDITQQRRLQTNITDEHRYKNPQ